MDTQFICIFGDILSGKESPRRIEFVNAPTGDDSGFIVGCGHSVESLFGRIAKESFLASHPDLRKVFSRMQVGDVAEMEYTTTGSSWTITDKEGVVRYPAEGQDTGQVI